MSNIKLSIILPCYNVEHYIAECLDSLYAQDIPETEYEVICINDCSPDGTRDIIVNYQQRYSNLILIDHEVNKRQGGARNTGLKAAKGEYIWFVDPDDFVKKNCFFELLNKLASNKLDILQFRSYQVDENGKNSKPYGNSINVEAKCIDGKQYYKVANPWVLPIESWTRVFNRDYLITNSFFYPEISYGEDDIQTLYSMFYANRIILINNFFYYYRQNPKSTMTTPINFNKLFQKCFVVGWHIIKFSKEIQTIDNKFSLTLLEGGVWRVNQFLKPLLKFKKGEIESFFVNVLESKNLICMIFPYMNKTNKIILSAPNFSKKILISVSKLYHFLQKK